MTCIIMPMILYAFTLPCIASSPHGYRDSFASCVIGKLRKIPKNCAHKNCHNLFRVGDNSTLFFLHRFLHDHRFQTVYRTHFLQKSTIGPFSHHRAQVFSAKTVCYMPGSQQSVIDMQTWLSPYYQTSNWPGQS